MSTANSTNFESIILDFWGVRVRTRCVQSDIDHLRFFYGEFEIRDTEHASGKYLEIVVECQEWYERGFFKSVLAKDNLLKSISIFDPSNDSSSSTTFRDWSGVPSPFPPFASSLLADRTATYPGAVLKSPNGTIYALTGSTYVGKTATALALCGMGHALISDSLIILDLDNGGAALKYETPIGLRRKTMLKIVNSNSIPNYRETMSPDTGLVILVKPEELTGRKNCVGGVLGSFFQMTRSPATEPFMEHSWIPTPELGWYSNRERESIYQYLPDVAISISGGMQSTPNMFAELIDSLT